MADVPPLLYRPDKVSAVHSSEVAVLTSGSIGNAKIAGMQDDLRLSSGQYSISLIVFFISYVIFEVPSK